jgi:hypothetical protein
MSALPRKRDNASSRVTLSISEFGSKFGSRLFLLQIQLTARLSRLAGPRLVCSGEAQARRCIRHGVERRQRHALAGGCSLAKMKEPRKVQGSSWKGHCAQQWPLSRSKR